jgi:hypothetical protein
MIAKFSLHYTLILVLTFKLKQWLWYHLWTMYTTVYCMIQECCGHNPLILVFQLRFNEWLHYPFWTTYWNLDSGVSYTNWLVSIWDHMIIQYYSKMIIEISMDYSIHISMIYTTVEWSYECHKFIRIGGVTLSNWWVWLLDSIYI